MEDDRTSTSAELEQRWRAIARLTADALFTVDPDGTLLWVSEEAKALMGLEQQQAAGCQLLNLVDQADRARVTTALRTAVAGEGAECRVRWRRTGSGRSWVRLRLGPAVEGPGRTTLGGTIHDVDAEVAAHQAFHHERDQLQGLLHMTVEPHVQLRTLRGDDGGISDFAVAEANEAATRLLGLNRGDRLGATLDAVVPPGEERASAHERLGAVLQSGGEQVLVRDIAVDDADGDSGRRFDLRAMRAFEGVLLSWRDVTQRHQLAAALSASEQDFRLLAESIGDVVRIIGIDGIQRWVSPSVTNLLGYTPDELVGTYAQAIMHPDDLAQAVDDGIRVGLARGTVTPPRRTRVRHAQGHWVWTETTNSFAYDDEGRVTQLYAVTRDAEAAVRAESELHRLATSDPLTGLLNRSSMLDRLAALAADHGAKTDGTAVLFCDLDDLKTINDTLGHAAGDEVIVTATRRIAGLLSEAALFARFGGDELLIAIPDVFEACLALDVAEDLRTSLAEPTTIASVATEVTGTASIGVALWRSGESVDEVISRADQAMYEAKSTGRNRVVLAR